MQVKDRRKPFETDEPEVMREPELLNEYALT